MAINMREPSLRPRRHGECIEPVDRRALERAGWRTMLDYRENHVRGRDGQLIEIQAVWVAEAERFDGTMDVASATGGERRRGVGRSCEPTSRPPATARCRGFACSDGTSASRRWHRRPGIVAVESIVVIATKEIPCPPSTATVTRLVKAQRAVEGDGFVVRRPFPTSSLSYIDPFLLFDHMGPVEFAPGEGTGTPWHPHRGFETVTYLLEGDLEHRDSMGNHGYLHTGDTQWMTAGSGVLHKEGPSVASQQSVVVLTVCSCGSTSRGTEDDCARLPRSARR